MKVLSKLLIILAMLSMQQSFGSIPSAHSKSFMPKNSLKVPVNAKIKNDMTKEKFEAIINRVFVTYDPIVKAKNATLQMEVDWNDETVNAYADQFGSTWIVYMYGGLARHHFVTDDGFLLVVCHETGHHLGGQPKYAPGDWASNEGQADYFGALKCMKRVLEKDDNVSIVAGMTIDSEVVNFCGKNYKTPNDIALCERTSMAGKSVSLLLAELNGEASPSFSTPDKTIVKQTINTHPNAQCRLDTFFSGALCTKLFSEDVSDESPVNGTCVKSDGFTSGFRPLCWYKPGCDELGGLCLN